MPMKKVSSWVCLERYVWIPPLLRYHKKAYFLRWYSLDKNSLIRRSPPCTGNTVNAGERATYNRRTFFLNFRIQAVFRFHVMWSRGAIGLMIALLACYRPSLRFAACFITFSLQITGCLVDELTRRGLKNKELLFLKVLNFSQLLKKRKQE